MCRGESKTYVIAPDLRRIGNIRRADTKAERGVLGSEQSISFRAVQRRHTRRRAKRVDAIEPERAREDGITRRKADNRIDLVNDEVRRRVGRHDLRCLGLVVYYESVVRAPRAGHNLVRAGLEVGDVMAVQRRWDGVVDPGSKVRRVL